MMRWAFLAKAVAWLRARWISRQVVSLASSLGQRFRESDIREFIWPILLEPSDMKKREDEEKLAADRVLVSGADFSNSENAALDEARRMADAEAERRRGADQKASTYLAVVAALAPLLLAGATAIWEGKAGSAPPTLNLLLLGLALLYMAAAGIWAFRVLEVSPSHRIGAADLVLALKKSDPEAELARQIIWSARSNFADVNRKVSRIKMTHAFLLRAFLAFVLLLLFNILFSVTLAVFVSPKLKPDPWLASANHALLADARMEWLRSRMTKTAAWRILAPNCGKGADRSLRARLLVENWTHAERTPPSLARLFGSHSIRFRKLQLHCGKQLPVVVRVWDVPARFPLVPARAGADGKMRLPPIDAMTTRIKAMRLWPQADGKSADTLPHTLLRQSIIAQTADRSVAAYVEIDINRGALGPSPPHDATNE